MNVPRRFCRSLLVVVSLWATASGVETVLEDFSKPETLRLGGQNLLPETRLSFAEAPAGGREAVLRFRFIPLAAGIPTAGIQFPPLTRTVHRPARRLTLTVRGDRAGQPLRLTMKDRSGELHMYQFEPTAQQGQGGSIVYATSLAKPGFFCWGGDGNKQLDHPLHLDQLFLDGNGNHGAEGTVFLGAISVDGDHDNRPQQAGKPYQVADYAKPETVVLGGDRLDPASRLAIGPVEPFARAARLHFRFMPQAGAGSPSCGLRFLPPVALKGPLVRLLIPVRGDAARLPIRANLFDAGNELHMFTCVPADADATPDGYRWLAVDFTRPPLFTAGGDGDKVLRWPARLDLLFIDGNGNQGAEGDLVVGPITAIPDGEAAVEEAPRATMPFLLQRCERRTADASTWGDRAEPEAALALDRAEKFEGEASLRLDYRFAAVDTGQAAFIPCGVRLAAGTARIRAAARSAGRDRAVYATLIDAKGTFHTVPLGAAPADRWQVLSADLAGRAMAWPVTWRDLAVTRERNQSDQGRVWVDALGADLADAAADHLVPSLDLGRWPPLCWGRDDLPRGALVVEGGAAEPATQPLSYRLLDHRRRQLGGPWSGQVTAKAGVPFRQPLDLRLPGFGVFELEVKLGGRTTRHAFSWLPERSPQWAEGPFGVNATPMWLLDAMAGIGMAWNRAEYGWRTVEHVPGVYQDAAFAGRQAEVAAAGMRSLLLIGDWGPQQSRRTGRSPDSPELFAAYASYCAWMAKANPGPLTRHFQIWNEPNLAGFWWPKPDLGNYAKTLIAAHAAIKAADPQAQVVGVNMSCLDLPFLDSLLGLGCGKAMDVLALHPYHLPEAPERFKRAVPSPTLGGEFPPGTFLQQMGRLDELLKRHGASHLKLWLDEYGYADRPDLYPQFAHEEWRAGALVVRQSLQALTLPQVERLFVYNARDTATGDAHNWDNATGIVRSDGSPKGRFAAWATMTRLLDQRRFSRSLAVGDGAFAYEFVGPAGPVLALWCLDGARTLAFTGAGDRPAVTASMGGTVALTARQGRVVVGISEEPVYLSGWSGAQPAGSPVEPIAGLRCAPGETVEVAVPGATGDWQLDAPAGWQVRRLAPGRFALTPDGDALAGPTPILLTGEGLALGTTLTYGDTVSLGVRPGIGGAEIAVDNPYARARTVVIGARRDAAVLATMTVAAAPRTTTIATLPLACEGAAGFTTIPAVFNAAFAEGEAPAPLVIAAGARTVVGATPCPRLVDGAVTGKPCLLDRPEQQVRLKPGGTYRPDDLSASFRTGWDAQRLRLEMTVVDDVHRPASDPASLWKGDSLQFALVAAGVLHAFDVAIPATGGPALGWRRAPAEGSADGLVASGTRSGTTTTYVVELPWRMLGITDPGTGDLRFALLVNDDDGAGRHAWMEWFDGIGTIKDPSRYGPLVVLPAPGPAGR
jgi:hypothetical protein